MFLAKNFVCSEKKCNFAPNRTRHASHRTANQGGAFCIYGFMRYNKQSMRIREMEQRLDKASAAVMHLSAALDEYVAAGEAIRELSEYYSSSEWKQDLADDEAGRLPHDMKRGVLSEDGIWNLLEDNKELLTRIQSVVNTL